MKELTGFKGISAWLVYNKVAFHLAFIRENCAASRRFYKELAKALTLTDVESLHAFIAGLSVETIPARVTQPEAIAKFKDKPLADRRVDLMECLTMVDLLDDDIMRLLAVHSDANGIPYTKASVGNLSAQDLTDRLLDTLVAASCVDVDMSLVTKEEKELLGDRRLEIKEEAADLLAASPDMSVRELLALAIKRCFKGVGRG